MVEKTQDEIQRDYVRSLLIRFDIDRNGLAYQNAVEENDLEESYRQLKNGFLAYSLLNDALKSLSIYAAGDDDMSKKLKNLKSKLEFMNHLRNKCSGHLDDDLLAKAIQWAPSLFTKKTMNSDHQMLIVYKTLLESAINSYLDNNNNQKYFNTEIDLAYPPNWKLFIEFMSETSRESLCFLDSVIEKIKSQLELITSMEDLYLQAIKAGQTDFNLYKKGR